MPNDLLTVTVCAVLITLSTVLMGLFILLLMGLRAQAAALRELRQELTPLLGEFRQTSQNLLAASAALRHGMQEAGTLAQALGGIGADLELGRRTVKSSFNWVGRLLGPWLRKFAE
jgi:hypothetical protein